MKKPFWILILLLIILHQDFWFWDSTYLVGGVMPIGLAYHIGISIAATLLWLAVCLFSWPEGLDRDAPQQPSSD